MLKAFLRRALAALTLSLALVGGPLAAKPTQVAKPALWEVSDPDTTIYLFGTIHLLPPKYQWRSAKLDKAMTDSQQLVVETLVDTQKFMAAMASLAFNTPNLPPLAERVAVLATGLRSPEHHVIGRTDPDSKRGFTAA